MARCNGSTPVTDAEPLGSAADEAARLLDALRRWVDGRIPEPADHESSGECRYCPLCQAAAALRHSQPEVYEHVSHAIESLLAAVRASTTAATNQASPAEAHDVEHIVVR